MLTQQLKQWEYNRAQPYEFAGTFGSRQKYSDDGRVAITFEARFCVVAQLCFVQLLLLSEGSILEHTWPRRGWTNLRVEEEVRFRAFWLGPIDITVPTYEQGRTRDLVARRLPHPTHPLPRVFCFYTS